MAHLLVFTTRCGATLGRPCLWQRLSRLQVVVSAVPDGIALSLSLLLGSVTKRTCSGNFINVLERLVENRDRFDYIIVETDGTDLQLNNNNNNHIVNPIVLSPT